MNYYRSTVQLIESDVLRMRALKIVGTLDLPDWLIAAGFVRNLVWDSLSGKQTELNDIDVIYYCPKDVSSVRDKALEQRLQALAPELPWSVKNQARMHTKNGDRPYLSSEDAMSFWPEKQTAIGVSIDERGALSLSGVFGCELLFNGRIDRNEARGLDVFLGRVEKKGWLDVWPNLTLEPCE